MNKEAEKKMRKSQVKCKVREVKMTDMEWMEKNLRAAKAFESKLSNIYNFEHYAPMTVAALNLKFVFSSGERKKLIAWVNSYEKKAKPVVAASATERRLVEAYECLLSVCKDANSWPALFKDAACKCVRQFLDAPGAYPDVPPPSEYFRVEKESAEGPPLEPGKFYSRVINALPPMIEFRIRLADALATNPGVKAPEGFAPTESEVKVGKLCRASMGFLARTESLVGGLKETAHDHFVRPRGKLAAETGFRSAINEKPCE